MNIVNSALRVVSYGCAIVAAIGIGITALIYVAEVIFRYGLNNPLNWSGDLGSYMLCLCVFMGIPLVTRKRGHIAVTVVLDTFPEPFKAKAFRALEYVTSAVLFVVAYFVLELCIRQFSQGVLTTQANQIPRWWLTALITVGLLLSALNFIAPADKAAEEIREF